jgi:ribosomal protein S18 acetylase RimI-like enzyme
MGYWAATNERLTWSVTACCEFRHNRGRRGQPLHQRKIVVNEPYIATLAVTYMELLESPALPERCADERIAREQLSLSEYLHLYRRVGEPLRWDQRLKMPAAQLEGLLEDGSLCIFVLRDSHQHALGFCEFELRDFPDIELKNFGLIRAAQGRGLGPWLLATALNEVWKSRPTRIWLHTDSWDHPAAIPVYERAGFRVYDVRQEAPGLL